MLEISPPPPPLPILAGDMVAETVAQEAQQQSSATPSYTANLPNSALQHTH